MNTLKPKKIHIETNQVDEQMHTRSYVKAIIYLTLSGIS